MNRAISDMRSEGRKRWNCSSLQIPSNKRGCAHKFWWVYCFNEARARKYLLFDRDRFENRFSDEAPASYKYLDCDLLIIDDLGSEIVSSFSVSCLYNIINTRLNKNLPIIASTNFSSKELRQKYHDRITSRLFGEFNIKMFQGKDIRQVKKTRK